jgi:hypothetical protein
MSKTVSGVLLVSLLSIPAAAFADSVYPLTGQPDIYIDNLTYSINYTGGTATSLNLTGSSVILPNNTTLPGGAVEAISDVLGTDCSSSPSQGGGPCELGALAIAFNANATGFTITGQTIDDYNNGTSGTTTYLAGTLVAGSYQNPGGFSEFGELFTVTAEDITNMNSLEQTFASYLGTNGATNLLGAEVFFDFDSTATDGDMEPYLPPKTPVPEPATLTLLGSGLAAGLLRKRLARKRA